MSKREGETSLDGPADPTPPAPSAAQELTTAAVGSPARGSPAVADAPTRARRKPRWRRWLTWKRALLAYLILLIAHHVVVRVSPPDLWGVHQAVPADAEAIELTVPAMRRSGEDPMHDPVRLVVHRYAADTLAEQSVEDDPTPDRFDGLAAAPDGALPVIVLHGSPSQGARDFEQFAPPLAATGRTVYAIDRPGFGRSESIVPSYATKANAYYTLAAMDKLGIERVHLVGWSYSGAVVVHAARLAPDRVASITLLGAMATQQGEGSGSYFFEHFKYLVGFPVVLGLPELIPHFGLLPPTDIRHAFIRDFWDTDLRPIKPIMQQLETPALVLHGRDDPLVPDTTAELHHSLLPNSRLVMLDGSHFLPLGPPMGSVDELATTLTSINAFVTAHDTPNTPVRRGVADFAPKPPATTFKLFGIKINPNEKWWLLVLLIVVGTFISEDLTVIAVGLAVATGGLDWGVALLGCFLGIALGDYGLWALGHFGGRRLRRWPFFKRVITEDALKHWSKVLGRHTAKAVFLSRMLPGTRVPLYIAAGIIPGHNKKFLFFVTLAVGLWTPLLLLLTLLIGPPLLGFFEDIFHGPWAIIAAFVVLIVLLRIVSLEATDLGRQRLKADLRRFIEPEFWPQFIFYAPLVPYLVYLAVRHRSATVFTAVNPAIPNGGGVVGEPKTALCNALAESGAPVLPATLITPDTHPDTRLAALRRIFDDPDIPIEGYPVVLKPDAGQRGFGVRVVRNDDQALAYLERTTTAVQAQQLSTLENEVGILWSRIPQNGASKSNAVVDVDDLQGEIVSITRKTFPVIEGDGEQTIEQLIWDHPRFRMQAKTFVNRWSSHRDSILSEGAVLRLAHSGNHAQGAMFTDGADLITPELSEAIERIARAYRDPNTGARLDFGRFDLRYTNDEELKTGRGFQIIEINGVMSESTNMYDPSRSVFWMYRVLFAQWRRIYALGALRRAQGGAHLGSFKLIALIYRFYRTRQGDPLGD